MSGAVKLVDAAGTLRLDLNGHRVHFTREQALELFVALGAAMDDVRANNPRFPCAVLDGDGVSLEMRQSGRQVGVTVDMRDDSISANLTRSDAIGAAVALVSMASEIPQ